MNAICIQVKHWLFLNSTSFIQMNDGPRYSALCSIINIHRRPAPLTKSANHQHLLFKWQTAAAGVEHGEGTQKKRWTNQFRFQSSKDKASTHQSNEKRQLYWFKHTQRLVLSASSNRVNSTSHFSFAVHGKTVNFTVLSLEKEIVRILSFVL